MPTQEELVAHGRSVEEIRAFIDADQLIYQDVDAMKRVVGALNPKIASFDASCFDGHYVAGGLSTDDFANLRAQRRLQFEADDHAEGSPLALQGVGSGA
jgi:amidophosphoribosyltransferase